MPHNTLVLYTMPDDPQAFRDHYVNNHLPLVAKLPGIRSLRYTFDLSPLQGESPYFGLLQIEWEDAQTMGTSLSSPEGQAVQADLAPYMNPSTVVLHFPLEDALSR